MTQGQDREHHPGCEDEGLYRKYLVYRTDGLDAPGERHHGCRYFVLDLTHDPDARLAALAYAAFREGDNPRLTEQLRALLREMNQEAWEQAQRRPPE